MPRAALLRCHYFRDTRPRREVDALMEIGCVVDVLCLRERGEALRERRGSLRITRVPLRHRPGAPAWRLLGEYIGFFVVAGAILTLRSLRRRYDVVQVNSVPDALVYAAIPAKRLGARVVLDLQEPLPEFFATKFAVAMTHPLVRLIGRIEQASIRAADRVITPTEPMSRVFCARGADPEKMTVVMDGADEAVFHPAPSTGPRANGRAGNGGERSRRDRFLLVSHGTIEPQYGLDTVIRAVSLLAPDVPGTRLHIIGDGSQRGELQTLVQRLDLGDRVEFSDGFVPEADLVAALRAADVGIVAMKRDRFRDLTLAGKMFDFVAVGLPMAVARTRSVQETLGPGCYEGFTSDDPRDLAAALRRLHEDPARRRRLVAAARDQVRPIAWPVQRRRYQDLIHQLTSEAAPTAPGSPPLRPRSATTP